MTEGHSAYEATQSSCPPHSGPGITNDGHPVDARLNYAFVRRGGLPSPLPLTIPQALLDAATADLRPILLEKLEAEGVILKLGEIRFWRTVQPLETARAINDPDVWVQKEGAERKFEATPFTESLLSSFGDWIQDKKLLHLIVTGGEAPFILEPAAPDPSTLGERIRASQSIAIGSYSVCLQGQIWQDAREGDRRNQDISIPWQASSSPRDSPGSLRNTVAQTPTVLLGINHLDTGSYGDEIQLLSYVSDVHPNGFRGHFDSFGRTLLYKGHLSWIAITPHHHRSGDGIQCGTADSQSSQTPRKLGQRSTKKRVLFRQAYERTPNVFSCLAGLNTGGPGSTHWDIRTFVTNIDREGFTLHIEKTRNSEQDVNEVVANAQTSWVAFHSGGADGQKMACGEGHLVDGVRTESNNPGGVTIVEWRGWLVFTEVFTSPPQVFAAFTSFDVDRVMPVRLVLEIESVTREGMGWKVRTWAGTVVWDATFAYFAVGDS